MDAKIEVKPVLRTFENGELQTTNKACNEVGISFEHHRDKQSQEQIPFNWADVKLENENKDLGFYVSFDDPRGADINFTLLLDQKTIIVEARGSEQKQWKLKFKKDEFESSQ